VRGQLRVVNDKIPAAITKVNYLLFDPPNDFESQAVALAKALKTDIAWFAYRTLAKLISLRFVLPIRLRCSSVILM
jgi:hypothetical protein